MEFDEKITVSDYNPDWESQFDSEKALLQEYFPNAHIEHYGSTSIKGMTAKPIVDIMIGINNFPPSQDSIETLKKLGYYHFDNLKPPHGNLYFVKRGLLNYNATFAEYEGELWNKLLRFRNYLRSHEEDAKKYSELKRSIIAKGKDTLLSYFDEKKDFVSSIIEKMNNA